jgi:hypothetical protein
MKLEDLLKKTTPGPFTLLQLGGCSFVHCQIDNAKPERIPQKEVCHVKTGIYDAALMIHCTNELPATLDVLKRMKQEMWTLRSAYTTEDKGAFRQTIDRVDTIMDEAAVMITKASRVDLEI